MTKAIIFDLDGTLIDTLEDIRDSLSLALEDAGLGGITTERTRALVGKGVKKLVEDAAPDADDATREKVLHAYLDNYNARLTNKTRPYEGILQAVAELSGRWPLAVLSNKPHDQTVRLINALFPPDTFKIVFGQREGVKHKPDPQAPWEICSLLDVDKSEVVFIGDSEVDIQTGHNAGMRTVGCAWGFRPEELLRGNGADVIARRPGDLPGLIDNVDN